jgi:serine phosphatase RsbU (regulator of sigma subunit)
MDGHNGRGLEKPTKNRDRPELERAAAVLGGLLQHDGLRDPAVAWTVIPSHRFSGDAVAAQRTASGRLTALLADAAGHGLAAAVGLLPAVQAFYRAASRDLALGSIAREMNRSVRETGRSGQFVAAVLAEVEPDGNVKVWNGGIPTGLWVRDTREAPSEALRSRHLPLGILPDHAFDPECTILDTGGDGHIVFFSDGSIEAANALGEPFGVLRLRQQMRAGEPQQGLRRIVEALTAHVGSAAWQDDIALLALRLG